MTSTTRRPFIVAIVIAGLAAALALLPAACEYYPTAPDESFERPSLTGFEVSPDRVELSDGAVSITFSVSARTPGGADSATVTFISPSGAELLACSASDPIHGSRANGTWECDAAVLPSYEAGIWQARSVEFHIADQPVLSLSGDDLRSASYAVEVRLSRELQPVAGITAPEDSSTFAIGDTLRLRGWGAGGTGAALTGNALVWSSDRDGELGRGAELDLVDLSIGAHDITLTVTDEDGRVGSDRVHVVVEPRAVTMINIVPEAVEVEMGDTVHLTAVAYDSTGAEIAGVAFDWSIEPSWMGTVDEHGVVTAIMASEGPAVVTAAVDDVRQSVEVLITPTTGLPRATIHSPAAGAVVVLGDSVHFSGSAIDIDGEPITDDDAFWWLIDDQDLIGYGRELTALLPSVGEQTIDLYARGEYGFVAHASVQVEVEERTAIPVVTIESPADGAVFTVGDTIDFIGSAIGTDGAALTGSALRWRAGGDGMGSGEHYRFAGLPAGTWEIDLVATDRFGQTAEAQVRIKIVPAAAHRVEVTPGEVGVLDWDPIQLTARAYDAQGLELPDVEFVWASSDTELVVVDAGGLAGRNPQSELVGSAWVTATAGMAVDSVLFVVGGPDVWIDGPDWGSTFAHGEPVTFEGRGESQDGASLPDSALVWTSSLDGEIGRGRVLTTSSLSSGEHNVRLTGTDRFGHTSAFLGVQVTISAAAPLVSAVEVREFFPLYDGLMVGESHPLEARALDADGQVIPDIEIIWTSSDEDVATVEPFNPESPGPRAMSAAAGEGPAPGHSYALVYAQAPGRVTIRATAGGVSDDYELEVVEPSIDFILLHPWDAKLSAIGDTVHFTARALDRFERPVTGVTFSWSSSDPSVFTVDEQGVVTARGFGVAEVIATAGGVTGSATIHVTEPIIYRALFTGSGNSCGVTEDYDTYCWGYNFNGKLGDGVSPAVGVSRPVLVTGELEFETIAIGSYHMVGLTRGGQAYAWGGNEWGQFGNGTTTGSRIPVPVAQGLTFVSVTAHEFHTVALTADGTAYAWGRNHFGQLGDGTTTDRLSPVPVATDVRFTKVSAGREHTIALATTGEAYGWGSALNGQLGNGNSAYVAVPSPQPVAGGLSFIDVSAGTGHSLGLTADGTAYGWGFNFYGELGDGSTERFRSTPHAVVSTSPFVSVSAGQNFSVALDREGNAYAWGNNTMGKLGDGTLENRNVPVLVTGGHRFLEANAGTTHAAGLGVDGIPYGWGSNSSGQLGTGNTNNSSVPVPAIMPGVEPRFSGRPR